jgi:hypothetical protein
MTYELDGRQYVLVAAKDTWFAFALFQWESANQLFCASNMPRWSVAARY